MLKSLPKGRFKWLDAGKLINMIINSLRGIVLEVDIEYSREFYELYNSYPLATDKLEIKRETLSDYIN